MNLRVSSNYPEEFIASLKPVLQEELLLKLDYGRVEYYKKNFNLDVIAILFKAISNMTYSKTAADYIYTINKTVRYKKYNLANLIKKITYGTFAMKGYPILEEVFRETEKNISVLYGRWLDNGY